MLEWIVALIIIGLTVLTWSIYSRYSAVKHIPGSWQIAFAPFRIPFIAPYIYFGTEHVPEMVEKFGDKKTGIVRMSMLGRNIVIVSHKDHIKELLLTKEKFFKKYPPSYEAFKIFGDNILSMLEADTWKPHHRICSPAFSSNNLKFVTKVTCESFDEMVAHRWEKLPDANGSFILPIDDYSDLTLQVLGRSIFGLDFGLFSDDPTKNESNFRKSLEILLTKGILFKRFLSETPILKYLYPYVMSYFGVDKALELVSTKLDKIIQEKKEIYENDKLEGTEHNDLLTMMIETNSSLTESQLDNTKSEHGGLTKDEIKSNSFIFSLAGNEVGFTINFTCILQKFRLVAVYPNGLLTF